MTKEQMEQLLKAVEKRIEDSLGDLREEAEALKKQLDDVQSKFGEEGELTKKFDELAEQGDQIVREAIVGTEEKPGLVQRIEALEKLTATRKSLSGQENAEGVTKEEDDPLWAATRKAIEEPGRPVSIGTGR